MAATVPLQQIIRSSDAGNNSEVPVFDKKTIELGNEIGSVKPKRQRMERLEDDVPQNRKSEVAIKTPHSQIRPDCCAERILKMLSDIAWSEASKHAVAVHSEHFLFVKLRQRIGFASLVACSHSMSTK